MSSIIKHIDYDYNGYDKIIRLLSRKYSFLKLSTVGKSVFGREIKALTMGSAPDCILYTAAIHGTERITATVLLKFIEELCEAVLTDGEVAGIAARKAIFGKKAVFVPLCNPDGCEISLKGANACGSEHYGRIMKLCLGDTVHWNANLRGVDLNHNFDAGWEQLKKAEIKKGYLKPGPTKYGGQFPESEPETLALTDFCRKNTVRHLLCFHTQGEVIYWDYNNIPVPNSKKIAEIFAASSGYALDVPNTISIGGGFKDWFIKEYKRPGFTIELGRGKNPLPSIQGEEIYKTIKEMLMVSLLM